MKKKETVLSVLKSIDKKLGKLLEKSTVDSMLDMTHPILMEKKSWATITDTPDKKTSELIDECKALFPVWSYYSNDDLDKLCPAPKKEITKVFKESIEPDCLGMSYNDAIEKGIKFMSARERIILELQYFKATGKGLDIKGWTITSTLDADGGAMCMDRLDYGQFSMDWCHRDSRYSDFGPRVCLSSQQNRRLKKMSNY